MNKLDSSMCRSRETDITSSPFVSHAHREVVDGATYVCEPSAFCSVRFISLSCLWPEYIHSCPFHRAIKTRRTISEHFFRPSLIAAPTTHLLLGNPSKSTVSATHDSQVTDAH
eukprot:m.71033 g.71033  ORF g.71033 m.71033 type:complete len:113 (+) comp8681_c0_seq1:10-348(+)